MKLLRNIIFALFFLSGVCGLIYELSWTRMLTLTFGTTSLAVSAVLTCFFAGLALGSFLGGKFEKKIKSHILVYGTLEILIGVYAFIFPLLLPLLEKLYVHSYDVLNLNFISASFVKFLLSALILIVPTTLMGATLPIICKCIARKDEKLGYDIGNLYSINTIGAVIGCIIAGFILIPSTGVRGIIYIAGCVNIIIGLLSFVAHGIALKGNYLSPQPYLEKSENVKHTRFEYMVFIAFFASGFSSLALEVIWTKLIGMIFVGTVYAFTTVLASYLIGIAIGSKVVGSIVDKFSKNGLTFFFGLIELTIGIITMGLIIVYANLPQLFDHLVTLNISPDKWTNVTIVKIIIAFSILLFPTFLFGATFPIVCKLYTRDVNDISNNVGNLYAFNTFGAILGSFSAGFILVPFMGMQKSIIFAAFINVIIGIVFIYKAEKSKKSTRIFSLALGITICAGILFIIPKDMPKDIHRSFLRHNEDILYYKEGASATVMISKRRNADISTSNKRIWINGNRASAAFYEALQINRFQGILPFLFQKDPQETLVICFGTGTTFGTLSEFDLKKSTVVEISKTVIEGAPNFSFENHNVIINPKAEIIIDDGRNFLLTTKRKFDVITQEPMHPSLSGVVNLYTKEYYELAKSRLTKNGIMSQWIPLYNMSVNDVKMLTKTFKSVFPHTSIFIVSYDIFLLGSPEKFSLDYAQLEERLKQPNLLRDLKQIDLANTQEIMNTFVMNEDQVTKYVEGVNTIITDDMPLIEFTSPKVLYKKTVHENIREILKFSENIYPYVDFRNSVMKDISNIERTIYKKEKARYYNLNGRGFMESNNARDAVLSFKKAISIDSDDKNSKFNISKIDQMFRMQYQKNN